MARFHFVNHALVAVTLLLGLSNRWISTNSTDPNLCGSLWRTKKSNQRARHV